MFEENRILIVIPARGGSKRLPQKNILPLAGKPLICWTIEAALKAKLNAQILVTSDDNQILKTAGQYQNEGVLLHKRSDELATDSATTVDVIEDVCEYSSSSGLKYETIILLQPTSPLRNAEDIKGALELYSFRNRKDTVVSVCEVEHPTAWIGEITDDCLLSGIDFSGKRSQEYSVQYRLNGAIYIFDYDNFRSNKNFYVSDVRAYIMPNKRSVDIDSFDDFELAEFYVERLYKRFYS